MRKAVVPIPTYAVETRCERCGVGDEMRRGGSPDHMIVSALEMVAHHPHKFLGKYETLCLVMHKSKTSKHQDSD